MSGEGPRVYVAEEAADLTGLPRGVYCLHIYPDDPTHPMLMFKPAGEHTFRRPLILTEEDD